MFEGFADRWNLLPSLKPWGHYAGVVLLVYPPLDNRFSMSGS